MRRWRVESAGEHAQTKSIKLAAEMAELANVRTAPNNRTIASLRGGKFAEALWEYNFPSGGTGLRAKAKEAMDWQDTLVAENEKERK